MRSVWVQTSCFKIWFCERLAIIGVVWDPHHWARASSFLSIIIIWHNKKVIQARRSLIGSDIKTPPHLWAKFYCFQSRIVFVDVTKGAVDVYTIYCIGWRPLTQLYEKSDTLGSFQKSPSVDLGKRKAKNENSITQKKLIST